jgi:hypothetical protein
MKGNKRVSIALLTAIAAGHAAAGDDLERAYGETKYIVDWRVRYEYVEQDGFSDNANALTSRVRAGFESGAIGKTKLLAEIVGTSELSSQFNSTTNGQTQYPVVADPGGIAGINRFALINQSLARTKLTFGRQRLILDDARFVGNVGWRQNEQTFDGLVSQTTGEKFAADFAYFTQVNRIFGPDSPNGEWNGDVVLLRGSRTFGFGKLTAFAYGMEFDEAPAASNDTFGLTLSGSRPFGETSLIYTLSAATQSEAGPNPADYSESYSKIEGGVSRGRFSVALGREVLGGDGSAAFVTPLATLHAFQGWGDKFLATPANGIDDGYLRFAYRANAGGPFESINISGFYHDFSADRGSADYGDELDLAVAARAGRITLTLKYAAFGAASLFTDTDKLWFSMDYAF